MPSTSSLRQHKATPHPLGTIVPLEPDEPAITKLKPFHSESTLPSEVITIDSVLLKRFWEDAKVLNDIAYTVFALEIDRKAGKSFELGDFCWRWRGEIENKQGDVKELAPSVVMKAIEKMEDKGFLRRSNVKISMTVQLDLFAAGDDGQERLPL